MTQPYGYPQYPVNYPMNPPPRKTRRGFLGWFIFLFLAIVLLFALRQTTPAKHSTSLNEFRTELEKGNVSQIEIGTDQITGQMKNPAGGEIAFETQLPSGTTGNWEFTDWLLSHNNGNATIVASSGNLLLNILIPLVPWLFIFLFIWLFVFRKMRGQKNMYQPPSGVPFTAWIYPYQPQIPEANINPTEMRPG
jgi:ATP-dependent Zn protease